MDPSIPRPRAVAFGEALAVLVQSAPGPLEDAETFRRSLGGAEANVAIGLARLGVATTLLTRVGDDGLGRYVRAELTRHGVDTSAIEDDPHRRTGLYLKEVGGDTGLPADLGAGRSRMLYYRTGSAGSALSPGYLRHPGVAAAIATADVVHTTGITPALGPEAAAAQRELADRVAGRALVSFDLNWRAALWHGREAEGRRVLAGFLRASDIAFAGLDESEEVFGITTADRLRRAFPEPRFLLVKDGGAAVVAFDGAERVEVAPETVEVVEAIGAGDAFAAGVLAGMAERMPLRECITQGHRAAALVLRSATDHVASGLTAEPAA